MSFSTQSTKDVMIQQLAGRKSYRRFIDLAVSPKVVDQIIEDGTQAPTSCNHQLHHFICIYDQDTKDQLQKISGSNDHFRQAPVVVVIAFHKGWNHNKFAIVQSTAAVVYHMTLSAHLRGLASVWNAGIGNSAQIAKLLDIPLSFEIIGVLCIGHGDESVLNSKPPRRPVEVVRSVGRFERPKDHIYPLKPATGYPYERIKNHLSPFAEHDPRKWDLPQIASWRAFAVFAKSPTRGIFVSRRLGTEMPHELATLGEISPDMDILEVMPFAGHYTTLLARKLGQLDRLQLAELALGNLRFAEERVANELCRHDLKLNGHVMEGLTLPFDDNSFDRVFAPQVLETVPDWQGLWSELLRVCRPGGIIGLTVRNRMSWFGLWFLRHGGRGQVTNFGPYLPQKISPIRARVIADAGSVTEYGISPRPTLIGQVSRNWLGLRTSRLWAAQVTVRK